MRKIFISCGLAISLLAVGSGNAFAQQDPNQQLEEYLKSQGAIEVKSENGTEYKMDDINTNDLEQLKKPQLSNDAGGFSTLAARGTYRIDHGSGSRNGLQVNNTLYGYAYDGWSTVEWNDISGNSVSNYTGSVVPKSNYQSHSLTFNGVSVSFASNGSVSATPQQNVLAWSGSSAKSKVKYDLWSGVDVSSRIALYSVQYASTGNAVVGITDYRHTTYASISP